MLVIAKLLGVIMSVCIVMGHLSVVPTCGGIIVSLFWGKRDGGFSMALTSSPYRKIP